MHPNDFELIALEHGPQRMTTDVARRPLHHAIGRHERAFGASRLIGGETVIFGYRTVGRSTMSKAQPVLSENVLN